MTDSTAERGRTANPRNRRRARFIVISAGVVLVAAVLLLWRSTPLSEFTSPDRIAQWIATFDDSPWAAVIVIAIYVLGGFIAFPVTVLITATALVFHPVSAFTLSMIGSMLNAVALYWTGVRLTRTTVYEAFAAQMDRVNAALADRSVLAIAAVRMIPVAPFTIVNLAAGSIGVSIRDYILGTALGLAPGIAVMTAFGQQLRSVWEQPTLLNVGVLAAIVLAWLALSLLLQRVVARWRARRR